MTIRRRRAIGYTDSLSSLWSWLLAAGVLVAIGYGVFTAIRKVNQTAEKQIAQNSGTLNPRPRPPSPSNPGPGAPSRPGPSVPEPRKDLVDRAAGDLNASVLAREAARLRSNQAELGRHLDEANAARRRLEEVAAGGPRPEHLEAGDEVLSFQDQDLSKMSPDAAGDFLARAARSIPPGTYYKARVRRNGAPKDLYLYFPQPAGAEAGAGERVKISNELAQELQQQVLSLPADRLYADDRRKIEKLLGAGTASREEYAFLIRHLAKDQAGALFDEKESFAQQIVALEKLLPSAPIPDALLTKGSHRIPGRITSETPASVTIETVLMPLTVPREEIQVLYAAKDLREEFDRRLKTAVAKPEAFPQLLLWCRDWGLPVHRELVAFHMMQADRNDRQARLAANYFSSGEGKWSTRGNISTTGVIPVAPKPESRAEIQPLLESYGFTENGGRWYKRTKWETGIDNLHAPGSFPMKLQGLTILSWREDDTPQSRDPSLRGRKTTNEAPRLRFIAPVAVQGVVTLSVEAPAVLVDCQLRVLATIVERGHGARVEVLLTPDGGKSTTLYNLDEGGNDVWHDIGAQVTGKKRFTVTARLTTTKDAYHTYARFLPSIPESKHVFWARGTVLVPTPEADRVWLGARP